MSLLVALLTRDDLPDCVRPGLGLCREALVDLRRPRAIAIIAMDVPIEDLASAIDRIAGLLRAIRSTCPPDAARVTWALHWLELSRQELVRGSTPDAR